MPGDTADLVPPAGAPPPGLALGSPYDTPKTRAQSADDAAEKLPIDKGYFTVMIAAESPMKHLTAKQVLAVLEAARENSTRDWCMFLLTFRHALRSQEARQLKLIDVDLKNLTITIARVKGSRSGVQSLDRHKGESTLDEVVALKAWINERVEDGSQILFTSQKGGMMTRMQFLRLFRRYAEEAKLPSNLWHPHTLRHALCSVMAAQHADVYAIQQRAGHKNISNTMVYTHVSDQQASESCQAALMSAFG
jgi:site-specific recombinase XerD